MNQRQLKKASKKAKAELERRWPGQFEFVVADGDDTVYAPCGYRPPRREGKIGRRFAHPLKGTPLVFQRDYFGEHDVDLTITMLNRMDCIESTDWDAEAASLEQGS